MWPLATWPLSNVGQKRPKRPLPATSTCYVRTVPRGNHAQYRARAYARVLPTNRTYVEGGVRRHRLVGREVPSLLAPSGLGGVHPIPSLRSEGTGSAHVCARGAHGAAQEQQQVHSWMWPQMQQHTQLWLGFQVKTHSKLIIYSGELHDHIAASN